MRIETALKQSTKDFETIRHKYKKLKYKKASNVEDSMKALRDQMTRLEDENKNLGAKLKKSTTY